MSVFRDTDSGAPLLQGYGLTTPIDVEAQCGSRLRRTS